MAERKTSPQGEQRGASDEKFGVSAPSITLPKGGGAISGIGEKFAANPVTGTGSMTRAGLHVTRSLRLWSSAFLVLQFRRRQRSVWIRLELIGSVDHAKNGQGSTEISRC